MFPIRDSQPSGIAPVTCWLLILANVMVLLWGASIGGPSYERVVQQFGLVPAAFSVAPLESVGTIFSSMFLHAGLLHLLGNMWFLHVFGDNAEARAGHVPFLVLYLGAGVAGGVLCLVAAPESNLPTIGASGAVAGVLGAYLIWFPSARINTLVGFAFYWRTIPVRAWLFIGFWFALQLLGWSGGDGGVAWGAHVGGFVVGVLWAVVAGRGPRTIVD